MATRSFLLAGLFIAMHLHSAPGGSLVGFVRDRNWYARYENHPYGVGYYEYGVNGNATNSLQPGVAAATGIFGQFTNNVAAGNYTVASWDVWWRSAYRFNVPVPAVGSSPVQDLRLNATMWGYPAFWDDLGYAEFGQTFVATGPITMVYLRLPQFTGSPAYRLTVHEGGPGGPQIGQERTFGAGDQRPVYGHGQMPTLAGRTYYARIRTSPQTTLGVVMQMDPRPDFSDPMPGGCLWLGPAGNPRAYPDRDLGLVIMSDDDGLITEMFTRSGGSPLTGSRLGQTFVARGVGLISAALWLPDPAGPLYHVLIRRNGPGGDLVGSPKRGKPARVGADPEMIVTWAPGECPLTPGEVYYLEVSRADGGVVNNAYAHAGNPYAYGQAYQNDTPLGGTDLAGTIVQEESPGSATRPTVRFASYPQVAEADRGTNALLVRWSTDVNADSLIEFAVDVPPYTRRVFDPARVTSHALALPGLKPHALYHFRVTSSAPGYRPVVSRDLVLCTKPTQTNLLLNPGFEQGATTASASRPLTNWSATGGVDVKEANGGWFWGLPPRSGNWFLQGAVNAGTSDGCVYQRVPAVPGKSYTFSAWVTTWPRENNTWKYDVWQDRNRTIYMRLGIDPAGGTNPSSAAVQWTPRMYSHLRYSNLAKTTVATGNYVTVFISMKGDGVQWHLYGADDCVLTETAVSQPAWTEPALSTAGVFTAAIVGDPGTTNRVQFSENLRDWHDLGEVRQTRPVEDYADLQGVSPVGRFYRLLLK